MVCSASTLTTVSGAVVYLFLIRNFEIDLE